MPCSLAWPQSKCRVDFVFSFEQQLRCAKLSSPVMSNKNILIWLSELVLHVQSWVEACEHSHKLGLSRQ
jgi:hypothetical protein